MEDLGSAWIIVGLVLLVLGPPGAMWAIADKKLAVIATAYDATQAAITNMADSWALQHTQQQAQWEREHAATKTQWDQQRAEILEWLKSTDELATQNAKQVGVLLDRTKR